MNEELQNSLAELIAKSVQTAESAKSFLLSEMPEVVQQLLTWKLAEGFLRFSISIAAIISIVFISKVMVRKVVYQSENNKEPVALFLIVPAFILLLLSVEMFSLEWIQVWLAPKVYLIEYAGELLK